MNGSTSEQVDTRQSDRGTIPQGSIPVGTERRGGHTGDPRPGRGTDSGIQFVQQRSVTDGTASAGEQCGCDVRRQGTWVRAVQRSPEVATNGIAGDCRGDCGGNDIIVVPLANTPEAYRAFEAVKRIRELERDDDDLSGDGALWDCIEGRASLFGVLDCDAKPIGVLVLGVNEVKGGHVLDVIAAHVDSGNHTIELDAALTALAKSQGCRWIRAKSARALHRLTRRVGWKVARTICMKEI